MTVATLVAVTVPATPASAAGPGSVRLVSHIPASPTTAGVGTSTTQVLSADGAFVAFASTASNLVAGQSDGNDAEDVFLFERATGEVTLVSHTPASATTTVNNLSSRPSISADGGFVAFASLATNVVANQGDGNGGLDVFLFERATGAVTLVSHTPVAMSTANATSSWPSISADGAFVAFDSFATNLVAGQSDANNVKDVFLFERADRAVTLVSHTPDSAGRTGNRISTFYSMSANGAFVAFQSGASDIVAGQSDANNDYDLFLFEQASLAVSLVSHAPGAPTTTANHGSGFGAISADGAFVAFESGATNLVENDANNLSDLFLFARATGAITLVSHTPASAITTANDGSFSPSISANGAFTAFVSKAGNLVAGQVDGNNDAYDLFLFERTTGAVTLVSHTPAGAHTSANAQSDNPRIAANGAWVTFDSGASNLAPGQNDGNGDTDVFLFERATGAVALVSHAPGSSAPASVGSFLPSISADGAVVAFLSAATGLVIGQSDANGAWDVFLFSARPAPPADFDGNARSEISVYRPSTGVWYTSGPSPASVTFGESGDIPVPGDYDDDGRTDLAVFRPSTGVWYARGPTGDGSLAFGVTGDIPVPADYDGDGVTDVAVFRPSTGVWYLLTSPPQSIAFGTSGDIPVPADYNGDGKSEITVFRPSNGVWYISGPPATSPAFGVTGDIPVPADYDGDGKTDIAVFRPSTNVWYVKTPTPQAVLFGVAGDQPQPGDFNGDGKADIAVFRPSTNVWYVQSPPFAQVFGAPGDIPVLLPSAIRGFFF